MKKILIFTILPLLIAVSAWASTEYFPNIYVSGNANIQELNATNLNVSGNATGVTIDGNATLNTVSLNSLNATSIHTIGLYGDDLTSAISSIGSSEVTLVIDKSISLSSNVTVPSNISLFFPRDGELDGTYGLEVNSDILAGDYKIFGSLVHVKGQPANQDIRPEWFGAKADGSTDSTTAIQRAINLVADHGNSGVIKLSTGTYMTSGLILKSGVTIAGQGWKATKLKLIASSNEAVITSKNFDTLTGSQTWLVSNGIIYNIGIKNLQIDGNKVNQTSGNGVDLYAKQIFVENLLIRDCKDIGWYSEAGDQVGQGGWEDLPEGNINGLWVRNCGSHGIHTRGPHDQIWDNIFANENGGWGLWVDNSVGTYSGESNFGLVHVYANTSGGVLLDARASFSQLYTESNDGEGIEVNSWGCVFGQLDASWNCQSTGTYNANFTSSSRYTSVSNFKSRMTSNESGLYVEGHYTNISNIQIWGEGSSGSGIVLNGVSQGYFQGVVDGFTTSGGIGINTNYTNGCFATTVDLAVQDCHVLWLNSNIGIRNIYNLRGYASASQTTFSGSGPSVSEDWNIALSHDGTLEHGRKRVSSGAVVDLNTTAEQSITINHGLVTTPVAEDIMGTILYEGTNTNWDLQYFYVDSVNTSSVTFKIKLSSAAGTATNAKIIMDALLGQ